MKGLVALVVGTWLVGFGLIGPWLEREPGRRLTLETQHAAEQCAAAHDHGICVQLQNARALLHDSPPELAGLAFSPPEHSRTHQQDASSSTAARLQLARAPPAL